MPAPRQLRQPRRTPPVKKQPWVAEWARSEAFWRDVASRTLSGIIVAAVAGIFGAVIAGLTGAIDATTAWKVVITIVWILLFIGLTFLSARLLLWPLLDWFMHSRHKRRVWFLLAWLVGFLAFAILYAVLYSYATAFLLTWVYSW